MNSTQSGIRIDVNRGPNWLFLRLDPWESDTAGSLLDQVWTIVSKHFVYRVVLEFGPGFSSLDPSTIEQLDELRHRLEEHDGALRVCGLDNKCAKRLEAHCAESKLHSRLTSHSTVAAAVFGPENAHTKLPGRHNMSSETEPVTQDIAYEALRAH
jgi:hypothetical protein